MQGLYFVYFYTTYKYYIYKGPGGSNSSYKPVTNTALVRAQLCKLQRKGCTRLAAASDKVYQLLAQGRWLSTGTPVSSTTKTARRDIAEILLKVELNTKNSNSNSFHIYIFFFYVISSCEPESYDFILFDKTLANPNYLPVRRLFCKLANPNHVCVFVIYPSNEKKYFMFG